MTRARVQLRGQEGSALIEVLATTLVLATLGIGVLMGLDVANARSIEQRVRAQALSVAQSELDVLRTLRFNDLRTLSSAPRTVAAAGQRFTVVATVAAAQQTNAPAGCSVRRLRDALEVTVSVTNGAFAGRAPVRLSSVVSAPVGAGGGLLATVKGVKDQPVAGLAMTLTGPGGRAAVTDAAGCARWDNLAGLTTYVLSFGQGGHVDPQGEQAVTRSLTVAPEAMNTTSFLYDLAGDVQLRFTALRRDPATGLVGTVASEPAAVAFDNAQVEQPVVRQPAWDGTTSASNTAGTGVRMGSLFPFDTTKYAVFAGACDGARPVDAAVGTRTERRPEVLVPRGDVARAGLLPHELRLPSLDVRVTYGGRPLPAGTTVTAWSCEREWRTQPVGAGGALADPGMPFGAVGLCASAPLNGTAKALNAWAEVQNTTYDAPPQVVLDLKHGNGHACPR